MKQEFWKDAQGNDLPEIDREVIALVTCASGYKVVYAHRVSLAAYVMVKGKKLYPKPYGKGSWNQENVKWWLDLELPISEI